ncbi:putative permease [Campylobacter blaseri]|uniref:Transporter n=1 Tax=Campylobacter blaseri TaxID=2042961 RepID=A0A2P8R3N8_9BACT|nr:AEC family transporter [Campylobacter blaseri]PSM53103.1 hypothetical protein CQ405_00705 [Campylobacter blaseri]PSM54569.1 hypothetical protein CRN67_00705 [Campylobacter blaseri]QKF86958.1 putative permease [Campylobacter blaseri]
MFTSLLSIFILIASGYFSKKIKIFKQKHSTIFISYALTFALPALIFDKIYHVHIHTTLLNIILTGFASSIIGACLGFLICRFLKFSKATTISTLLLALFGNTLFIGMPIITGFFGKETLDEIIFYDQLATSIPISILGPFILSFGADVKVSLIKNTIEVLKFPPFIALVFGFAFRNVKIPHVIFDSLNLFSASVVPVALFAIGLGLNFRSVKSSYKSTIIVLLCKMIVAPLLFITIALIFKVNFGDISWSVGILQCAMPPMVLASAMIMKANLDTQLAVSAVAMGVIFSFVSLPFVNFMITFLGGN